MDKKGCVAKTAFGTWKGQHAFLLCGDLEEVHDKLRLTSRVTSL